MGNVSNGEDLLYCFGCNERFRSNDLRGNCPRCGLPAEEVGLTEDGPTFLLKSADRWANRQPRPSESDEVDLTDRIGGTEGDC